MIELAFAGGSPPSHLYIGLSFGPARQSVDTDGRDDPVMTGAWVVRHCFGGLI
jgi:hypothetical protein